MISNGRTCHCLERRGGDSARQQPRYARLRTTHDAWGTSATCATTDSVLSFRLLTPTARSPTIECAFAPDRAVSDVSNGNMNRPRCGFAGDYAELRRCR